MKNVNVNVKLNGKADMMVRPERSGEKILVKAGETIVMKSDQATKLVRAYCQFEILGGTEEKVATAKKESRKEKQDRIKAEIQAEKEAKDDGKGEEGTEELIDFVVTAEFLEENKDNADLEGVAVGDTIKIPKTEIVEGEEEKKD